jgi:hypothetical protein
MMSSASQLAHVNKQHWADRYSWLVLSAFLWAIIFWMLVLEALFRGQASTIDRWGAIRTIAAAVALAAWLRHLQRKEELE